jgi:hypothetical protein
MSTVDNNVIKSLFDVCGKLPNGECIKDGDVVRADYYMYTGFYKVIEVDGVLSIHNHLMYGTVSISHFISQHGEIQRVTPKEVYLFCKKNNWDTKQKLSLFK